jgi:hypothetical protein
MAQRTPANLKAVNIASEEKASIALQLGARAKALALLKRSWP